MSDSEGEFESADEGSKGDNGWDIDNDFDLPDVKPSVESKPIESKLSKLPNVSEAINKEENVQFKLQDPKSSRPNNISNVTPLLQSKIDKLKVDSDNINSGSGTFKENQTVQNEIKTTNTQSNVSCYILFKKL